MVTSGGLWTGESNAQSATFNLNNAAQNLYGPLALSTNVDACAELFAYFDKFNQDLRKNASRIFGAKGYFVPGLISPGSALIGRVDSQTLHFIASSAIAANLFYNIFLSTGDTKLLKSKIFPFMSEVMSFYSDFLKLDKVYEATLFLGATSTTGDPEGEIVTSEFNNFCQCSRGLKNAECNQKVKGCGCGVPTPLTFCRETCPENIDRNYVLSAISSFIGEITQTPPIYSAIKLHGQSAYKLARKGQNPTIPPRQVTIYDIQIENYKYPELKLKVHCSSGTYIRTLAEDIGKKLGLGAYLTALRRTKIGEYDIKSAKTLAELTKI